MCICFIGINIEAMYSSDLHLICYRFMSWTCNALPANYLIYYETISGVTWVYCKAKWCVVCCIQVPPNFRFVVEQTLREFFKAIQGGKDAEQSWKKSIYKIISRLDDPVPEYFKSPNFLEQLEWMDQPRAPQTHTNNEINGVPFRLNDFAV